MELCIEWARGGSVFGLSGLFAPLPQGSRKSMLRLCIAPPYQGRDSQASAHMEILAMSAAGMGPLRWRGNLASTGTHHLAAALTLSSKACCPRGRRALGADHGVCSTRPCLHGIPGLSTPSSKHDPHTVCVTAPAYQNADMLCFLFRSILTTKGSTQCRRGLLTCGCGCSCKPEPPLRFTRMANDQPTNKSLACRRAIKQLRRSSHHPRCKSFLCSG